MLNLSKALDQYIKDSAATHSKWINFAIYASFFIFLILGLRYQILLLRYKEWGDESETIVAAKMLAAGMKLYSEVFNHHGPLTFLPGILVEKFGDFGIREHRVPIALLQILAIISIYKSPLIKDSVIRVCLSVAAATMMLVYMPEIFGHMYKYQTLVGLLLVIVLAQYTLPAILNPDSLNRLRVVLGNALIASLPFLAVTYLPIAILLFFASLRNEHYKFAVIGSFLGGAFNIAFIGIYSSFAGYLAFHIYLNAEVLPLYTGLQTGTQLVINAFNIITSDFLHFLSLVLVFSSATILAVNQKGPPWRAVLLVAGICSLLMRGSSFQGMPYFYAIFALVIPLAFAVENLSRQSKAIVLVFICICIVKVSLVMPGDRQKISSQKISADTEFSRLVQELTNKSDRIIAYSFNNFEYLASGRLPASGHYFYLPWQEKYNENPKFGIVIDACKQISEAKPKVMHINKWKVWDRFPWEDYAGCIQKILDERYVQYFDRPYYIRKDLLTDTEWMSKGPLLRKMVPGPPLDNSNPIRLKFTASVQESDKKLVRLGVMLGTRVRINPGTAELLLKRAGGSDLKIEFSLPDLVDNKYKFFDLPEDVYVSGSILSSTGGGISAWESHGDEGDVLTCVKYYYSNGSRSFTPGCPLF